MGISKLNEYNITTKKGFVYNKQTPYIQHIDLSTVINYDSALSVRTRINSLFNYFAIADDYLAAIQTYINTDLVPTINNTIDYINTLSFSSEPTDTVVNNGIFTVNMPEQDIVFTANQSESTSINLKGLKMYYGVCSTGSEEEVKVINITNTAYFIPAVGNLLSITFLTSNTVESIQFKINNSLYSIKDVITNNFSILANHTYLFGFDGINWLWLGDVTVGSGISIVDDTTAMSTNTYISNIFMDDNGTIHVEKKDLVIPEIPDTLPNPKSLTITYNGVSNVYDGQEDVTITIDNSDIDIPQVYDSEITLINSYDDSTIGSFTVNQDHASVISLPLPAYKTTFIVDSTNIDTSSFVDASLATYMNSYITQLTTAIKSRCTDIILLREKTIGTDNIVQNTSYLTFDMNNTTNQYSLEFNKSLLRLYKSIFCEGIDTDNSSATALAYLNKTYTLRAIVSTSTINECRLIYNPYTFIKTSDRQTIISTDIEYVTSNTSALIDEGCLWNTSLDKDKYYDVLIHISFYYPYTNTAGEEGLFVSTKIDYSNQEYTKTTI